MNVAKVSIEAVNFGPLVALMGQQKTLALSLTLVATIMRTKVTSSYKMK